MDIQLTSFILGICSVLVIALAIGSVYAVVKVMKLKNDTQDFNIWVNQEFENQKKEREMIETDMYRLIDETNKSIESRCDKLYEKIMKNKSPKNEVFEMADKDGFKKSLLQVLNNEDEGNDLKNRILQLMDK